MEGLGAADNGAPSASLSQHLVPFRACRSLKGPGPEQAGLQLRPEGTRVARHRAGWWPSSGAADPAESHLALPLGCVRGRGGVGRGSPSSRQCPAVSCSFLEASVALACLTLPGRSEWQECEQNVTPTPQAPAGAARCRRMWQVPRMGGSEGAPGAGRVGMSLLPPNTASGSISQESPE